MGASSELTTITRAAVFKMPEAEGKTMGQLEDWLDSQGYVMLDKNGNCVDVGDMSRVHSHCPFCGAKHVCRKNGRFGDCTMGRFNTSVLRGVYSYHRCKVCFKDYDTKRYGSTLGLWDMYDWGELDAKFHRDPKNKDWKPIPREKWIEE